MAEFLNSTVRIEFWGGGVFILFLLLLATALELHKGRQARRAGAESLRRSHQEIVEALAVAINAKDEVTHEHVLRVQIYAAGVARLLGCTSAEIEALRAGALLHDIGKIAVPDYILNKPGKLTAAEFEKMKVHTVVGAQILSRVNFPFPVVPIVRHHHERWDGRGYPDSLKGERIPLTARILSVVDCFDAVREDRPYRKGLTREEAIDFLLRGSGSQYDPRVVGTFITNLPAFEAEIHAAKESGMPFPTFGIEPVEQLSEAARAVEPAAGLAEEVSQVTPAATTAASAPPVDPVSSQALYRMAVELRSGSKSRQEILHAFAECLRSVVPYDACALTTVQPETGEKIVAHAAGQYNWLLVGRKIEPGEGVTGWVLANQRPFCNTDPRLDFPATLADRFVNFRTLAVYPVTNLEGRHGAVSLYSAQLEKYTEAQQQLLQEAATILAGALSSAPLTFDAAPPKPAARETGGEKIGSPISIDYQSRTVA